MPPSAYESDQKPQSKGFFSSLLKDQKFFGSFFQKRTASSRRMFEPQL
jgi:hypothetical protein